MAIRATVTAVDDTAGGTALDLIPPGDYAQTNYPTRVLTVRGDPVCIGHPDVLAFVDGSTGATHTGTNEGYYLANGESITLPYSGEALSAITATAGSSTIHILAPFSSAPVA